ncbi:MAG: hypothetical protein Kow0063_18760 [Anaerolineae bacterium]
MSTARGEKAVVIPEKRGYVREEFVGRRRELEEVAQRVSQGKKGDKIDLPVLNIWGIEGCGKSWLVRDIARRYRGPGRLRKGEQKRTFTAILDFVSFDPFEWTTPCLAALLRPAVDDIAEQVGEVEQETYANLLAQIEAAEAGKEIDPKDLAHAFVIWIVGLTGRFVPIILLDTTEQVTAHAFGELELHLIEPLARTDTVILITAGRYEVARWRRFAVRNRQSKPIKLGAFSPPVTDKQIRKQGFDLPGELVYGYSFGLAYASQVMATAIRELSDGHPLDAQFLRENEHRLEPWLIALDRHLLRSVSSELADMLRALCVLRAIREEALPYLLADKKNGERYRDLLDELEATPLVWWDSDQGTYLMPDSLRRLLSLRLRLQEPELFSKRHRQAAEYYFHVIEKNPYDCASYLIEALYHMAYGYAGQLPEMLEKLLNQVLTTDNFTVGGAEFLLEKLRKDDELRAAFPDSLLDQVIQSVETLRRDVRRMRLSIG